MKVNDSYLPSAASTGASRAQEAEKSGSAARPGTNTVSGASGGDDVHLSELVRTLRSLVADSPERQDQIERLARAAASGTYRADPEATASRIIDDSIRG
jgi:flagellar biosynthesis anti-sigma factor FlgM